MNPESGYLCFCVLSVLAVNPGRLFMLRGLRGLCKAAFDARMPAGGECGSGTKKGGVATATDVGPIRLEGRAGKRSVQNLAETTVDYYRRETLHHLIVRALQRNTFTANQDIGVLVLGDDVLLFGTVTHPDLIPEAVAIVEAVVPLLRVHCHLRVHRARARASR